MYKLHIVHCNFVLFRENSNFKMITGTLRTLGRWYPTSAVVEPAAAFICRCANVVAVCCCAYLTTKPLKCSRSHGMNFLLCCHNLKPTLHAAQQTRLFIHFPFSLALNSSEPRRNYYYFYLIVAKKGSFLSISIYTLSANFGEYACTHVCCLE